MTTTMVMITLGQQETSHTILDSLTTIWLNVHLHFKDSFGFPYLLVFFKIRTLFILLDKLDELEIITNA